MAKSNVRPDRLIGRTRWEFAGVADLRADPVWRAHLADLEARRPFRRFEYGALDEDGRPVHFEVNGTPVFDAAGAFRGYRGTASNITARKQAEEALRESETRFRSLVENMRDIIFCRGVRGDGAHGYDPDGALLFGADAPRIAGTVDEEGRARIAVWYDAVHPDDRGRYLEAERRRKEDLEPFALEYRIAHPDTGEERWMREVAWVVRDEAFGRTYFDSYIIDVTEQRRREATLAAALARLGSQAGEMRALAEAAGRASRAKSEFLARMSHEIRTPMNAMLGFAELLAGAPLPEEQRRQAGIILETGGQLLAILNDVLDLARLEAGRVEVERAPFRLDRLLEATRPVTEVLLAERAVAYELAVGPAVPAAVLGDAVRLKQVLANLLSNAAKFTDRGRVRLEVAPTGREGGGALLRFAVADTGAGIPAGRRERLFQPFGQLHDEGCPPTRRHGAGARDLAPAGRADGRPDRGRERARGRQHLLVRAAARAGRDAGAGRGGPRGGAAAAGAGGGRHANQPRAAAGVAGPRRPRRARRARRGGGGGGGAGGGAGPGADGREHAGGGRARGDAADPGAGRGGGPGPDRGDDRVRVRVRRRGVPLGGDGRPLGQADPGRGARGLPGTLRSFECAGSRPLIPGSADGRTRPRASRASRSRRFRARGRHLVTLTLGRAAARGGR
jgi:PAS domain S-box-containing protein